MTIWQFMGTKSSTEIFLSIVIITGAFWLIGLCIVFVLSKGKISRVGKDGIEIGPFTKTPPSPHARCQNVKDVFIVLKAQADMINRVRDIKDAVLPEQMRFAESVAVEIRGILQKTFLGLLEKVTTANGSPSLNLVLSSDYHLFRLCVRSIYEDQRDYVRLCFRENHLSDKTEAEFRAYIDTKTDEIIQKTTDLLNDLYRGELVSRVELYEANRKTLPEVREAIARIFQHARDTATKANQEAIKLEKEFEAYFKKTIM